MAVVFVALLGATESAHASTQIAVKATSAFEQAPGTGGGTYFAWTRGSRTRLLIQSGPGQPAFHVNGSRTRAWSGSIDGTTFVYQLARGGGNSDIRLMDVVSHAKSAPAGINTRRWEWHPTISGNWILFGRSAFDRNRSRVLLHNTSTGQTITLADVQGKSIRVDPGQVSGDYAVWDRCAHVCNVFRYQISTGQTTRIPNTITGQLQYDPSVTDTGTVYFVHSGDGCGRHVKLIEWVSGQPLNVLVEFRPGRDVFSTTQTTPDQVTGTDVYYDKYTCRTADSDIYKIVVP
jgi:hypothetical protein